MWADIVFQDCNIVIFMYFCSKWIRFSEYWSDMLSASIKYEFYGTKTWKEWCSLGGNTGVTSNNKDQK